MKEELQQLGFTPYEAEIYLTLIKKGKLSAYELADKTGLYRQAVYDALNRMKERGHVNIFTEGRRKLYQVVDPQILLDEIQSKALSFENILPTLNSMKEENEDPVQIELFQGKSVIFLALKEVVNALKRCGGINICSAVDEEEYHRLDKRAMEWYKRNMRHHGFKERAIILAGKKAHLPSDVTEYRTVEKKYFNTHPVQVAGDTILILLGTMPGYLIKIKNKEMSIQFRKMLELMWSVAKPLRAEKQKT